MKRPLIGLLLLLGCGDDDAMTDAALDAPTSDAPIFGVSVVTAASPQTAFLAFVSAIDGSVELDVTNAIEIPGAGVAVAGPNPGEFFTTSGDAPILTRWTIDAAGQPTPSGEISFERFSTSATRARPANVIFPSPTRGYVLDTLTRRMVRWNPQELLIEDSVSLEALELSGFIPLVDRAVTREGLIVVPVTYVQFSGTIGPQSRLLVIDPASDSIERVVDIDCAAVSHLFVEPDGTLYAASDSASITNRLGGLSDGDECIVRFDAGSFEASERTLFSEALGGQQGGGLYQAVGGFAFARVLDETLAPSEPMAIGEINATPLFRWARIGLGSAVSPVFFWDMTPIAQSSATFVVDGRSWGLAPGRDFAGGRLVDLSGDEPVEGLAVDGIVVNVFRLR
ncbi:MAG: hypothetical protein AAF411_04635 [Myxococcota bacterium]